jgi:hypothetical protein
MKARKVKGLDPDGPLAEGAERTVAVRLDELCNFVPKVFDPDEAEALHDMRIAAKRLRYVLEVTGDLFGPYADEARKRAKDLQELLGDIHDCDVLEPRVLALLDDLRDEDTSSVLAGDEPGHADDYRGLELLIVRTRARRRQLFERFLAFWTDLERDGFRTRLEYAIAERPEGEVAA